MESTDGFYVKIINGVAHQGTYRLWYNIYSRIDDQLATLHDQHYAPRYNGLFKYTFESELYSLDRKGWQKSELNKLCPTPNNLFTFYNVLRRPSG